MSWTIENLPNRWKPHHLSFLVEWFGSPALPWMVMAIRGYVIITMTPVLSSRFFMMVVIHKSET